MRYPCAGRSPPNIFFVFSKPSIVHRPILDPLHSKFPLSRLRHPRRLQLKRELDSQMYITCAALRARCCAGCCAETEDTVLISRELRFPFSFQSLLFCSRRACSTPGWAAETSQQQKEMRFFSTCGERLGDNSSDRDCGPGIEGVLASSLRRGSASPEPVRHRSGVEMTPAEVRFFLSCLDSPLASPVGNSGPGSVSLKLREDFFRQSAVSDRELCVPGCVDAQSACR